MPIYEFHCDACKEDFEVFLQGFSQRIKPECPKCKSDRIRKKMSGFMAGASKSSSAKSSGNGGGCGGCRASSCAGCRH
ncbi:MAG TPA: zinc ribbon domain-containing protein [Candidatus Brocadiia bacterium]|nr:zinc ribbon domain-containing protein [Candidatus Brocadiia bacterium]